MNAPATREIEYSYAGPTTKAFHLSEARRRVLLGPFGSGKSVACCWEIFDRACRQEASAAKERKSRFLVIRNTYPELTETTIKTWRDWFPDQLGRFVFSVPPTHRLVFPLEDGTTVESEVIFLALDRPEHVRKLLSLEVTGIYFNECREINKAIIDAADGRIGRYPRKQDGGPTWRGIIADTNMPDEDHWLFDAAEGKNPAWDVHRQPGGLRRILNEEGKTLGWEEDPDAENLQNLPDGYYIDQVEDKTEDHIAVYLAAEFGHIPTEGSYYAEDIGKLEKKDRITVVSHDPAVLVHTFWDLGIGDDTAIWFAQNVGTEWRFIYYLEDNGKGLSFYASELTRLREENEWLYGSHVWPHDGEAKELGTGVTRQETMRSLMYDPIILPRQGIEDGINAVRLVLPNCWFDKEGTRDGLPKLRRYKREFDEKRQVFLQRPLHDWTSHAADAFRTFAMGKDKVGSSDWGEPINYPGIGAI